MTSRPARLKALSPDKLALLLKSSDRKRAASACIALAQTGKKAYAVHLLGILQGKRQPLWMVAGNALSQLESKRTIRPLIRLMSNTSRPIPQRTAAAYALAFTWRGLSDARYGTAMGEAFTTIVQNGHEAPSLRGQAAEGLAYLYGPCAGARPDRRSESYRQAGEALMTALDDPSAEVRFWSAFALGSMRYQAALPALRTLARNDKERFGNWWKVGEEAADAIQHIKGRPMPIRSRSRS